MNKLGNWLIMNCVSLHGSWPTGHTIGHFVDECSTVLTTKLTTTNRIYTNNTSPKINWPSFRKTEQVSVDATPPKCIPLPHSYICTHMTLTFNL